MRLVLEQMNATEGRFSVPYSSSYHEWWGESCTEKSAALIVRCRVLCVVWQYSTTVILTIGCVKRVRPLYVHSGAVCGMLNVSVGWTVGGAIQV